MKIVKSVIFSLLSISTIASASDKLETTCRVVTVNESKNWLEEGLGVYGDPEVDSDSQEFDVYVQGGRLTSVKLGQMRFSSEKGDVLSRTLQGKNKSIKIDVGDSDTELRVVIYPSERAVVLTAEGGEKLAVMATLDCSSVKDLTSTDPTSRAKNVKKLTSQDLAKLPQSVKEQISKTDVPFELGDGYYGVKSYKAYKIFDKKSNEQHVGYVYLYKLSYTEGDDVNAVVRFDRNGLRVGEIETNF